MTIRLESVKELPDSLASLRRFRVHLWDDGRVRPYDFDLHVDAVVGGIIHGDEALQRDYQYAQGVEGLVGRAVARFARGEALALPMVLVDDNAAKRVA
jgi:hypothetical protein